MKDEKKPKFEVGEKCICYAFGCRNIVVITDIQSDGAYSVNTDVYGRYLAHPKQLRKLVKKKRRGWWIWWESREGTFIRTTKPKDTTGWIYVEEKRVK